uniref:Ubiquitin carboxyl-terminal hydrolase n=4 Tax=Rhizophora mucronata TaxID=61149 RepID=A0A2P2M494_RHIMU
MSRLTENLRFTQISKSTFGFSVRLVSLPLATLRLFKSLFHVFLVRGLSVFPSMDDDFLSSSGDDNNNFLDLDFDQRSSSFASVATATASTFNNKRRLLSSYSCVDDGDEDGEHCQAEKLYLVPHRWWREAKCDADQVGVFYNVSWKEVSGHDHEDGDEEIVLNLREEENYKSDDLEEGSSCRECALISGPMWLQPLKRHIDSKGVENDPPNPLAAEDYFQDMFLIRIRLSLSLETNSLIVKIGLKDNSLALYRRAHDILGPKSQLLHIWDYSGWTTHFFMNKRINLPNGSVGLSGKEIIIELQVYGFPDPTKGRDGKIDEIVEYNKEGIDLSSVSVKLSGSSDYSSSYSTLTNSSSSSNNGGQCHFLGLIGLENLGNTCFMNSTIQCLVHTPKLVDYFLGNYRGDINHENPLGMKGELALAFGDLLRKLWTPGTRTVAPRMFKLKLAHFAPQFSGYNQHDSQEFLAFLLDGLHEDLNRVKSKPYIEIKNAEDRPDKEVAEEYWRNHQARNDSIIVDLYQGQYRSTLVCPVCNKKSVTFDPFMYLSLPLPSTSMRTMTLTLLSADGSTLPSPVTITLPKHGRLKDLLESLSTACSLRSDETLLVAEVYKSKIFRFLEGPSDSLALIRDDDTLVAYRIPKSNNGSSLVVFMQERLEKAYAFERAPANWNLFGIPLVARISDVSTGLDLHNQFLKLFNPFLMPADDVLSNCEDARITANGDSAMEDIISPMISDTNTGPDGKAEDDSHLSADFQFYLEHNYGSKAINMTELLPVSISNNLLNVCVRWSEKMIEKYDTCLLSVLPEVFKPQLYVRPQESASLYKCLEAFLREEPLGPDDMWYCPNCKKHRQASKKLDLWRLPEILVVHLKRFSYNRYLKNKLETYVDFPIDDLDLSTYISHASTQFFNRYVLYAISNHYGSMGGGHYTAFVNHGYGKWYEFDDDNVYPVGEDRIKSFAAYVLFYRRVT